MRESNYELFFGLFANKLKVEILAALMQKPMEVAELAKALSVERSKVSHALLKLNKCRIVEAEKKGKFRVYSLNKDTVPPLLKLVDRHVSKYCTNCWAKIKNKRS